MLYYIPYRKQDTSYAIELWDKNMRNYTNNIKVFDGIVELLKNLLSLDYEMGIVTSKTREEFTHDFCPFGISHYFKTIICADDTQEHKPNPAPILQHEPELLGEMKLELEKRKETEMRLALVQMPNYGSKDENLHKSLQAIEIASKQGADLVLFPEVQLTEFFPQYPGQDVHKYTVTIEGETVKKFCDICRNNKISAVPNLYLLENDRTYDASIFIDKNGEVKGTQKMVHIAQAEQFYEQDYYTPSDEGFKVFDTEFGKIGIVVCFDRHYPESIRTEVLRGAELILIPTVNTKAEPSLMFEWELRVQAFQNSVILAMCNRVGTEGNMCFSGESIVVDAKGDILAKADDTEQILYVDIDMQESLKIRNAKPYTQLRRPDFYL